MMARRIRIAIVVASVCGAALASDVRPGSLFDAKGAAFAWDLLAGFGRPDLGGDFLARIGRLSLESLAIGMLGTAIAAAFGTIMALLTTRVPGLPDAPHGSALLRHAAHAARLSARFLLGVLRAIPDIVWAFFFVRLLGLGPGPAVLAIAVSTGGIIGKLFAELADAVDPGPIHALRRAGASRLGLLLYGVLPQVRRQWLAYALFRLECSIRSASILGVVGAGGLGTEIVLSVRYFQFDKLATALLAVLLIMIAVEAVSAELRRRPTRWTLLSGASGTIAAIAYLDIPWSELFRSTLVPEGMVLRIAGRIAEVVGRSLSLVGETLAMAWCATIAAAAIAFLLAPLATRQLMGGSYLADPPGRRGAAGAVRSAGSAVVRFLFQVSRAMPELTLALVAVVWVGPGPFAGVLAIALHTIGVFGRLYGDVYEEVEPGPVAALEASGAGRIGVWLYAVVPQVMPRILAFTLYRFEVNVRMTAIVGFVGAGGIGDAINTAFSLFHVSELAILLALMVLVVTVLDWAGDRLRYRILVARFSAGGSRAAAPSRLSHYRSAPPEAHQGDEHGMDETEESWTGGDRKRRAVVRLLGARED